MSKSNTIKFSKLKAMNEKNKDQENTSSLKKVLADSKTVSKISFHNGLIGCIYIAFMFIVAFVETIVNKRMIARSQVMDPKATVLRDGKEKQINGKHNPNEY